MEKNEKEDKIEYIDDKGQSHDINEWDVINRVKTERNKGDFTSYLLFYAKNKKQVVLHTWVYKGMVGIILNVDLRNRVFTFYNASTKKKAMYSINIVRGVEEA